MKEEQLNQILIGPDTPIRQVIACIDRGVLGIALVVDDQRHLLDTITDGDVRRAVLAGLDLETPVAQVLARRSSSPYPEPITAPLGSSRARLLSLMRTRQVRHIPLLDESGRLADLATMEELLPDRPLPVQAMIMAGSPSRRLHPSVQDLPKPMLPVGNRPLLELTLEQLRQAGIHQVHLATNYKSKLITDYFGDGSAFGVRLHYHAENRPLETEGPRQVSITAGQPLLVIDGDVLTRVNYRAMLDFHREQRAEITIAVRQYEFNIPFAVVEADESGRLSIQDRPTIHQMINAGIYLIEPELLNEIDTYHPQELPARLNQLAAQGRRIASFPLHEYWLDIQEYEDYQRVLADARQGVFGDLHQAVNQLEPGTPAPPGFIPLCVPEVSGKEWAYIKECLDTNWVSSVGPFVDRFEELVATYVGTRFAVATSSGTAALHVALLVAGVQPDDEVLVSDLSFIAPAFAIRYVGAWPVMVDVDPYTWQMDVQRVWDFLEKDCAWQHGELRNKQTGRRVRAILPVHILGHPVDMDPLLAAATRFELTVIEDATESLGAAYKSQRVGSLGDAACFSFNGNKVITTGGGGMLVTDREDWARRARYLTTQAKDDPLEYIHKNIGYNYRLTNLQAAMGCAQMESLPGYIAAKRRIAATYRAGLQDLIELTPQQNAPWAESIEWLFTVLVHAPDYGLDSRELLQALSNFQIQTRPLWQPLHLSPALAQAPRMDCPTAERLHAQALSLPSSVGLSAEQQAKVLDALHTLRNSS